MPCPPVLGMCTSPWFGWAGFVLVPHGLPWDHRTLAWAWRGHGAGVARTTGIFLAWGGAGVARAWCGRGAGMSCPPRQVRRLENDEVANAPAPAAIVLFLRCSASDGPKKHAFEAGWVRWAYVPFIFFGVGG
eukprot:gene17177-biopygen14383